MKLASIESQVRRDMLRFGYGADVARKAALAARKAASKTRAAAIHAVISSGFSVRKVASLFGVSRSHVSRIARSKSP